MKKNKNCYFCGRSLKDPYSVNTGVGPECKKKIGIPDNILSWKSNRNGIKRIVLSKVTTVTDEVVSISNYGVFHIQLDSGHYSNLSVKRVISLIKNHLETAQLVLKEPGKQRSEPSMLYYKKHKKSSTVLGVTRNIGGTTEIITMYDIADGPNSVLTKHSKCNIKVKVDHKDLDVIFLKGRKK